MRLKKLATALSLTAASLLGFSLLGGCAEDRTTLFISGVLGFPAGSTCDPDASLSADLIGHGSFDPGPGTPYRAYLLVGNGIQPLGDNDTLRPETSRIILQGAVVSVTSDTGTSFDAFTTNFAGTINPTDSEDPGMAAISVPLIPGRLALSPGEYVLHISVFGETLGGIDVESPEFSFPITVEPEGSYIACEGRVIIDEDQFHPCGNIAQDGYVYNCLDDGAQRPCNSFCTF